MTRRWIWLPLYLLAAAAAAGCGSAVKHGHNTALDGVDLVAMTDDMAAKIVADPEVRQAIAREGKLKVVVQGSDVDPWGKERAGLEVVGVLKRSDFDMKFNQALGSGNVLVGDKVNMSLDISAVHEG